MRTSILPRTVIAVATLAIGPAALAAAPAHAAAPTSLSRATVLTAVDGVRAAVAANPYAGYVDYDDATRAAVRTIVEVACSTGADEMVHQGEARVTPTAGAVDGLVIRGIIGSSDSSDGNAIRFCLVGASATRAAGTSFTGSARLTTTYPGTTSPSTISTPISGNTSVTGLGLTLTQVGQLGTVTYAASGAAVTSTPVTTTTRVKDVKTPAQLKAAKKAYSQRLKAAKKAYAKAVDKAGSSKSKKAAAKKSYSARKASAKAAYQAAITSYSFVTRTTSKTSSQPFGLSIQS